MAAKNGNQLIVKEYRTKYPDMPSKKLARIIYAENNLQFKSWESALGSLRYIEGKQGEKHRSRKTLVGSPFVKEEARPYNPYKLPPSDEIEYEPFIFKGYNVHLQYYIGFLNYLIFPFCHFYQEDIYSILEIYQLNNRFA